VVFISIYLFAKVSSRAVAPAHWQTPPLPSFVYIDIYQPPYDT